MRMIGRFTHFVLVMGFLFSGCSQQTSNIPEGPGGKQSPHVLAVESFLADIAQNVAGSRMDIELLIPPGLDPHNYELTPQDVAVISNSDLLLINGSGYESWLEKTLSTNRIPDSKVVEASQGLQAREINGQPDPHFWMDPNYVMQYVDTIRAAFIEIDPTGEEEYTANSDRYKTELSNLDQWIRDEVQKIPENQRIIVTNHESIGYFIDRYGFVFAGSLLPGASSEQAPSAQQIANMITVVRRENVKAIFIESGANPDLADQLGTETGIRIITDLYTESLSPSKGPASTYIDMIKYDVKKIVDALR